MNEDLDDVDEFDGKLPAEWINDYVMYNKYWIGSRSILLIIVYVVAAVLALVSIVDPFTTALLRIGQLFAAPIGIVVSMSNSRVVVTFSLIVHALVLIPSAVALGLELLPFIACLAGAPGSCVFLIGDTIGLIFGILLVILGFTLLIAHFSIWRRVRLPGRPLF